MKKYSGVVVPLVSPFRSDFSVDENSARKIALKMVDSGSAPFVLGSTGEGPSMGLKQKSTLVKTVADSVMGRALLYAGISANSVDLAIEESKIFVDNGADVLVATLPYYYPIDEDQMLRYFEYLADNLPLPLIVYNMPGMVKRSIPLVVADKISHHPNIVGMKDSERDEARLEQSIALWKDREDFSFLVGWAAMSAKGLALGADGIVPSTGNICPSLYVELYKAVISGNIDLAAELQQKTNFISSLYQANRDLSHSIPALKAMMSVYGLCSSVVLPPMYSMETNEEKEYLERVKEEFKKFNC